MEGRKPTVNDILAMKRAKAAPRYDTTDPMIRAQFGDGVPQTHHGVEKLMHPGEWHPIHSLKVAVEARRNIRNGR